MLTLELRHICPAPGVQGAKGFALDTLRLWPRMELYSRLSLPFSAKVPFMTTERTQQRLQRLLDQIDETEAKSDWASVRNLARDVLDTDPENPRPKPTCGPLNGV